MTMSYKGPAVVDADGEEITVAVDWRVHQETSGWDWWGGSLLSSQAADLWEAEDLILRLPDGRESKFVVVGGSVDAGELDFEGRGSGPF
ncbi:hypothetical protein ACFRDV_35705 [Streptomyces fagopyri]|uniref:hypothetical protein n=1 Tax=Streptomyces fagopyri TaxID=2662397 RepID=UPI00367AB0F5